MSTEDKLNEVNKYIKYYEIRRNDATAHLEKLYAQRNDIEKRRGNIIKFMPHYLTRVR